MTSTADRLGQCEAVIQEHENRIYEVGKALHQIESERLYSPAYDSFEEYVDTRWASLSLYTAKRYIRLALFIERAPDFATTATPSLIVEVLGIEHDDAVRLLRSAVEGRWSVRVLRARVREEFGSEYEYSPLTPEQKFQRFKSSLWSLQWDIDHGVFDRDAVLEAIVAQFPELRRVGIAPR